MLYTGRVTVCIRQHTSWNIVMCNSLNRILGVPLNTELLKTAFNLILIFFVLNISSYSFFKFLARQPKVTSYLSLIARRQRTALLRVWLWVLFNMYIPILFSLGCSLFFRVHHQTILYVYLWDNLFRSTKSLACCHLSVLCFSPRNLVCRVYLLDATR